MHRLAPQLRVDVMDLDRSLIAARVESGDLDAGFGAFFTRASGIRRQTVFPARLALAVTRVERDRRWSVRWHQIYRDRIIALPAENPIQRLVNPPPIGRAHVWTPVSTSHLVCALFL